MAAIRSISPITFPKNDMTLNIRKRRIINDKTTKNFFILFTELKQS